MAIMRSIYQAANNAATHSAVCDLGNDNQSRERKRPARDPALALGARMSTL